MDRSNPYEAAFEGYLKAQGLCYVGVDESRRAMLGDRALKNLDFVVLGVGGTRLLVDVKGRRFPMGPPEKPRYVWENWVEQDDIDGLQAWSSAFGREYLSLFVFVYDIQPTVELEAGSLDLWAFRDRQYLLRAVTVDDYVARMRVRSPKWATLNLRQAEYRALARPFRHFALAGADDGIEGYDGGAETGDSASDVELVLAEVARRSGADGGFGD